MKFCYLFFVTIFSWNSGASQDEVALTQEFAVGKTYSFEIMRGREDSRSPGSHGISIVTSAIAKIKAGQENKRIVTFEYGESRIEGIDIPAELSEQFKSQELYKGISISLIVDNEGNFYGLSSYESAKKQLEQAMIKMYESKDTKIDKVAFDRIRQQLAATYDTEEKLLDMYFPELSIYFNTFGNSFTKDEPQVFAYKAINPFGGEPFPVSTKVTYDETEGPIAIIRSTETIEPADLNRVMISTFKKIKNSGSQPFNENEIPKFNMITTSVIRYDTKRNLLISVSMNKKVTAENVEENTITEIRMMD